MPPEQDEAQTSVRGLLEAGFAADAAANPETPAAPAPVADAPAAAAAPDAAAPVRDEAGRFAPKDAAKAEITDTTASAAPEAKPAETPTPDSPATAGTEAPREPIPPPAALSAAIKSKWSTLPPEVQAEWAKRETDMVLGLQKQADNLKRFERLDEVIAPHRERLALARVDDAAYVKSLIAADEMLRGPNQIQALAQIGQMYGIDLRHLAQPGQQPPQAAQPDPQVQAMAQELTALKGELAQFKGAAQETEQAQLQAQVDSFAKDHPYFENVRGLMGALMRSGQAADMASAYEMACRASPEVHPVLMQEEADRKAAAARAEATQRASEARQASGSVTGSPAPGTAPAQTGPAPTLRESLERQFSAYA